MIIAMSLLCFKQHLLSIDFLKIIRLPPSNTKYYTVPNSKKKGGGAVNQQKKKVFVSDFNAYYVYFAKKVEGLPPYWMKILFWIRISQMIWIHFKTVHFISTSHGLFSSKVIEIIFFKFNFDSYISFLSNLESFHISRCNRQLFFFFYYNSVVLMFCVIYKRLHLVQV